MDVRAQEVHPGRQRFGLGIQGPYRHRCISGRQAEQLLLPASSLHSDTNVAMALRYVRAGSTGMLGEIVGLDADQHHLSMALESG